MKRMLYFALLSILVACSKQLQVTITNPSGTPVARVEAIDLTGTDLNKVMRKRFPGK